MTSIADDPAVRRRRAVFDHPALFYRTTDDYLAGTLGFIRDGLASGDPVAVAVPGPRLDLLTAHLGPAAGRIHLIDMAEAGRNPARIIGGVLRAFADQHPDHAVRIIGEPLWPSRSATEYPACVQHEALINRAFAGRAATILCLYDIGALHPRGIADVARTHPALIERGRRRSSQDYAPEQVIADYNRPLPAPADATTLTVGPARLPRLRQQVAAHAAAAGLSDDGQADWVLVLTELVTNSIEHGGGSATVRLFTEAGQVVGQVIDTGGFIDPLAGRTPVLPGQARGRGLLLVNDIADLVRLHVQARATTQPGTTTVEARLRLA